MRRFDAVIFDLDGTLLDSTDLWKNIDLEFLGNYGFEVPEDYMTAVMSLTFRETAEYTIRRFGIQDSPEFLMDMWIRMAKDAYAHKILLKEGARDLLSMLKRKGVSMCLATASEASLFRAALQNHDIEQYFDCFVTTAEAGKGKEHPDIYLLAAEKLGVIPERCLVLEDVYSCAFSAKKAGMSVYAVYDDHAAEDISKLTELCDRYVFSLTELTKNTDWLFIKEKPDVL